MKKLTLIATCIATLALTACGSTGNNSTSSSSTERQSSSHTISDSNACKQLRDNGGKGKNIVFRCNIASIVRSAEGQAALDNMPISYGGNGKYRTNAVSRSFGRDEAASCERAILNGVKNLQDRVKKNGGSRLTNVVAYRAGNDGKFDRSLLPAGQADCIVATWQSRAVMRGSVN